MTKANKRISNPWYLIDYSIQDSNDEENLKYILLKCGRTYRNFDGTYLFNNYYQLPIKQLIDFLADNCYGQDDAIHISNIDPESIYPDFLQNKPDELSEGFIFGVDKPYMDAFICQFLNKNGI